LQKERLNSIKSEREFMHSYSALILLMLFLQSCELEDDGHGNRGGNKDMTLKVATRQELLQVPDDGRAGSHPPPQYYYRDSQTGTGYLLNPGWHVIARKGAAPGLAKSSISGLACANTLTHTWMDWSGQIETRLYECVSPGLAQHQNSIGCQVEDGFILVGGGAYADYGSGPGALLWETRPLDENLSTWVASSKDHKASNPHTLYTYAIGMRLKDSSGSYIAKSVLVDHIIRWRMQTSSPSGHYPSWSLSYTNFESGYWPVRLFGGGARTNWTCCGSLLTATRVFEKTGAYWFFVQSKDHGDAELTTINLYAIAMAPHFGFRSEPVTVIPHFGLLEFKYSESAGSQVSTGVATALIDASSEYVMTGMGAQSNWTTGSGRLLFGIKPTGVYTAQITAYSKDHRGTSGGNVIATMAQIRKRH
jgi:hypothetical protein